MHKRIFRSDVINTIIAKYDLVSYLEVGILNPSSNFIRIKCKDKTSVDINIHSNAQYICSSDVFFHEKNNKTYDIIFIDGMHTEEQVTKDIINSLKCLNDNGFIIVHDCKPEEEKDTISWEDYSTFYKKRGLSPKWNGTVYKGFIKLKFNYLIDYSCFVVNEDNGCGIITKRNLLQNYKTKLYLNDLDWNTYINNTKELLQYIEYNEFLKIIQWEI